MRRRLPSPAVVIASLALFVALGGAGFAASLALAPVRSPNPLVLLPAGVSAAGKVTGPRMTGGRVSEGVYTLTIRGDTFAASKISTPIHTAVSAYADGTGTSAKFATPSTCEVATKTIAPNGSARLEVDCFAFGSAGWKPADTAFDVQIAGPGR
jgi:hypothetical protein